MPDLIHTLHVYDLGHLKIIAEMLGIESRARSADSLVDELCVALLDPETERAAMGTLAPEARAALGALLEAGGKMEWSRFARTYGDIREMGAARRDREQPHRNPASIAEQLFYRGLLAKSFFASDHGAQEFAYIADDLQKALDKQDHHLAEEILGRAATPAERAVLSVASDRVVDEATTLLIKLRTGDSHLERDVRLAALLEASGLTKKNIPLTDGVKDFLAAPRAEALGMLQRAWVKSDSFHELRLLRGLRCEGEWTNSPRAARRTILNFIGALPRDKWWSLASFLHDLKARHADFQRPAGDYDSWFIRRMADDKYLRGFESWDEVDGAVATAIIEMLHVLGQADLARPHDVAPISGFRLTKIELGPAEGGRIAIASSGTIKVPRLFPRAARYQLARFCETAQAQDGEHKYLITARSLRRAARQALSAAQLLSLLVKHSNSNVPPPIVKALQRWQAHGSEARVENLSVLRVTRPEVLKALRASRASKFLGEALSPTAVVVKGGAIQKVIAALAELGLLAEIEE